MATEVEAVYRKGSLELKSALPLQEGQTVRVVVLTDQEASVEARVAAMRAAAEAWLAQQSPEAVTALPEYTTEEWEQLDTEWDEVLAEIQQRVGQADEDEIVADVEAAVKAVRTQMGRPRGQ